MRNFKFLAILTTLATYLLIFIGGLVRVSGAGLGCPDWPKCFGSWIPPLSTRQLPPNIDPATFNISLAWIEYLNRLFGMAVGLLILALAIWAIIKFRKYPRILIPSIIVAPLTAFQGWQGSVVVSSDLEPLMVSVHMLTAVVIVGLLIYISLQTYYKDKKIEAGENSYSPGLTLWTGVLLLFLIAEVVLGSRLRAAFEMAREAAPLLSSAELSQTIGVLKIIHPVAGVILAILLFISAIKLLKKKYHPSYLIWQSAWSLIGLVAIQLFLGLFMVLQNLQPVAQVMHLWTASLMTGVVLIIYLSLRRKGEQV